MRPSQALEARLRAGGFAALLPAQAAVQRRLDLAEARAAVAFLADRALDRLGARRANGTAIEVLHHRRWPASDPRFSPAPRGLP